MTDLATLVVKMQADNSQYVKKLEESTAKLEKFAKEGESALGSIKEQFADIGAKLAAAFTVDKLIEFSSEAIESAASLEKLSQMTGIGVESLGSLRLAAAASGLSQEDLGQVLKKLNVNISEAAGNIHSKAGVAFQALGIAVTDASGKLKDAGALMPDGMVDRRIVTTRPRDRPHGKGEPLDEEVHYVYRRKGRPCFICGTKVEMKVMAGRNLFWCPTCQPD